MASFDSVLVRYGEIALKDPWTRKSWERTPPPTSSTT
jgi:adenylyl- and sulfurtransferase ThiI